MATYKDAGVDLEAADQAVDRMRAHVTATWGDNVVGGFGGFAAGIKIPQGYAEPVLMMSTDGVGTKAEVARRAGLFDGLGWDLVAMCADDLAAAGAKPLAMTDYLAVGKLDPAWVERIVASVATACAESDVALIGGETAEHPGVMEADEFDLAGAVVGIVEADAVVDGAGIRPGQAVIGLHSPNLRSNGFSLIRNAVLPKIGLDEQLSDGTAAEVLLAGSVLYSPAVQRLLQEVDVAGMAHVTGGGIAGNLSRVLPGGVDAEIDTGSWRRPGIFEDVAEIGRIDTAAMFQTFNMGIGFIAVVDDADVNKAQAALGLGSTVIGQTTRGSGMTRLVNTGS